MWHAETGCAPARHTHGRSRTGRDAGPRGTGCGARHGGSIGRFTGVCSQGLRPGSRVVVVCSGVWWWGVGRWCACCAYTDATAVVGGSVRWCRVVHMQARPCACRPGLRSLEAECPQPGEGDLLKVENSGQRALREGHVMCFKYPLECRAAGFHERDLARHLSVDDFQAYLKARMELMEQRLKMQLEVQIREEFEEEQRRLAAMDEHGRKVLIARKHIEEEILQMKCPRAGCRRAFFDFEGCFALSCSACPCKFCGWCLQDCGNGDAHPHVRGCGKVPQGVDALFPQMPDVGGAFEKTHNQRCRERVDLYVQTLELDIRGDVETIAQTLVQAESMRNCQRRDRTVTGA